MAFFLSGKCRLPILIKESRISAQDLADYLGMNKSQISDYANNRKKMSIDTAKNIAEYFGVPIDELYDWAEFDSLEQKESAKQSRKR